MDFLDIFKGILQNSLRRKFYMIPLHFGVCGIFQKAPPGKQQLLLISINLKPLEPATKKRYTMFSRLCSKFRGKVCMIPLHFWVVFTVTIMFYIPITGSGTAERAENRYSNPGM